MYKKNGSLLVSIVIFISIALAGYKYLENSAVVRYRLESANTFNRNVSFLINFTDDHMKNYVESAKYYTEMRNRYPKKSDEYAADLRSMYGWSFSTMGSLSGKEFLSYMNDKTRYSKKIYTPTLAYDNKNGLKDTITVEVGDDLLGATGCPQDIVFKFKTTSTAGFNSTRIRHTVHSIVSSFNKKRGGANCIATYEGNMKSDITIVLTYNVRDESHIDEIESIY